MANQVAGSQTKVAADVAQLKTDVESLNSNLTIRSKDVNIGDVIIGSQGYTDISSYKPSGMSHFLFATIVGFSYSLKYVAFGITSDARFMFGQASDTIKAVIVRYWYTNA